MCLKEVRERISRLSDLSGGTLMNHEDAEAMAKDRPAMDIVDAHVAFLDAARDLVGSDLPAGEA